MAKFIGCSKENDGNGVGLHDDNPILNTIVYDVKFPDGAVREYASNIIAENMLAQVESDSFPPLSLMVF